MGFKGRGRYEINAIYSRGSKKDFWDLDELLNHFSLVDMIDWFLEKNPHAFVEGVILSMISYEEADEQAPPICIRDRKWEDIKKRVKNEVWKSFKVRR